MPVQVRDSINSPLRIDSIALPGGGRIGLTLCPGKHQEFPRSGAPFARDLYMDLDAVAAWGASTVVTLMEGPELVHFAVEALGREVRARGMNWMHLPIRDCHAPDHSFELLWHVAGERLHGALDDGQRILLHCLGGLGRTGTIAARLLIERGATTGMAIREVRSARADTIETAVQEEYLKRLRPSLQRPRGNWHDRALGCLLGGAVGDAFGYTIEFDQWVDIQAQYGVAGLTVPEYDPEDRLVVSDDTQMTLFTLEALLEPCTRQGPDMLHRLHRAYLDWLDTQSGERRGSGHGLREEAALRHRRAPGITCLTALQEATVGEAAPARNDSKGCGGVMRVAPIGLLRSLSADHCFSLACEAARLTHGHIDGWACAGALAMGIRLIMEGVQPDEAFMAAAVRTEGEAPAALTPELLRQAITLAYDDAIAPRAAVGCLGEGWTGEEALAIGAYAALHALRAGREPVQQFQLAVQVAANHDGDSDSTASIAGQIVGSVLGASAIPDAWAMAVDVRLPLLALAVRLERVNL